MSSLGAQAASRSARRHGMLALFIDAEQSGSGCTYTAITIAAAAGGDAGYDAHQPVT